MGSGRDCQIGDVSKPIGLTGHIPKPEPRKRARKTLFNPRSEEGFMKFFGV